MVEPLQQRGGLEHAHARRRELERERQAVEPAADRGDRRRVRGGEREVLACTFRRAGGRARPTGSCAARRATVTFGAGSSSGGRLNSDSAPILSGARLVAITCSAGQRETQRGDVFRGVDHLLEIVEHQQHAALADHGAERVERRAAVRLGDLQRDADRRHHLGRRRDRGERDERRAAGILGRHAAEELDREARLAGATVSGHGEHARAAAQAFRRPRRAPLRGRATASTASAAA